MSVQFSSSLFLEGGGRQDSLDKGNLRMSPEQPARDTQWSDLQLPKMDAVSLVRHFGPGMILMMTGIGTSHLITAPTAGGRFAYALLWCIPVAYISKYYGFEMAFRFTNATGKSLIEGLWHGLEEMAALVCPDYDSAAKRGRTGRKTHRRGRGALLPVFGVTGMGDPACRLRLAAGNRCRGCHLERQLPGVRVRDQGAGRDPFRFDACRLLGLSPRRLPPSPIFS